MDTHPWAASNGKIPGPIFAAPASSRMFSSWAEKENNTLLAAEIRWEVLFFLSILSQLCAPVETKLPEEEKQAQAEKNKSEKCSLDSPPSIISPAIHSHCLSSILSTHLVPSGLFIKLKLCSLESKGHGHYR